MYIEIKKKIDSLFKWTEERIGHGTGSIISPVSIGNGLIVRRNERHTGDFHFVDVTVEAWSVMLEPFTLVRFQTLDVDGLDTDELYRYTIRELNGNVVDGLFPFKLCPESRAFVLDSIDGVFNTPSWVSAD